MTTIINEADLRTRLSNLRGATFCSIISVTDPKRSGMRMTATDGTGDRNPWVEGAGRNAVCHLRKVQRTAVCLNEQYDNGVRKQLEREGINPDTWTPGTTWYTRQRREDGTLLPFAEHDTNGSLYLCGRNLGRLSDPYFIDLRTGERVDPIEVDRFLPENEQYAKQIEAGIAPANVVRRQVWGLEGIRAMNINGERLEIHRSYAEPENAEVIGIIGEMIAAAEADHETAQQRATPTDAAVA